MLLIRLLAVFLVLITNTWLLPSPVRSNALSRYKRSMALRADSELSRLAGEPCTVSGVWRSRRQPRSLQPSQHRPPAARPRTHTSRRDTVKSALCAAGGCRFDTGVLRVAPAVEEKRSWGEVEEDVALVGDGYVTYEKGSITDEREASYVSENTTQQPGTSLRKDAERSVSSSATRGSSPRLTRSLSGTSPYEDDGNTSWEKVFPDSSTDSRGLQVLYRLQQEDGDQVEQSTEDYSSREVVEVEDPPAGSSSTPWGSPVPRVLDPSWMTALYFSGRREQLKVKPAAGVELPRARFSLELWVKPEGGQSNPAVIAGG